MKIYIINSVKSPKKRKTQEDKEIEKIEVESTGCGFDAGGG